MMWGCKGRTVSSYVNVQFAALKAITYALRIITLKLILKAFTKHVESYYG